MTLEQAERKKEYAREWNKQNADKVRAYRAVYRAKNREKLAEKRKEWCAKNGERLKVLKAEWYRKNAKKSYESSRRSALRLVYGITPEQYDQMFKEQGGLCKICSSPSPNGKNWHIDHCHSSGKVRGILCNHCNLLLGYAKDSTKTLQLAVEYLEASK